MIDYSSFHSYLVELVGMFQRTGETKGMSKLAQKWHCTAVTKDQFYQMKLDKMKPEQVTPQLSRVVRDNIGRSDAKQALRETIGALNEGILSGSRISQGSDRTVQVTITQPAQSPRLEEPDRLAVRLPLYRPGQIVYRKGGMMHLVSRLLDGDRFTWDYELFIGEDGREHINENNGVSSSWMGNQDLRPAKGNEVARFLGALTRSGYEWTADNANGLFFVKKRQPKTDKPVDVFAGDLPDGYGGIFPLPAVSASPYRFALSVSANVRNVGEYMSDRFSANPVVTNAVLRQIQSFRKADGQTDYMEYQLPTLCCPDDVREFTVGYTSFSDGTAYWLAKDRDVLRLLAWVSFIV